MRFFDWLFNRHSYDPIVTELPISVLNRWYIYDAGMGNENDLANAIGLSSVSEEGDDKEREDSDIRVAQIAYLFPFLDHMSNLAAETVAQAQKEAMLEDGMPLEQVDMDLEIVKNVYKAISLSSLMASFSIANELELIHTHPDIIMGEGTKEYEDNDEQ